MLLLWIKICHLFFVICWFAGLFYLPRLFVNHAMSNTPSTDQLLLGMERRLYRFMSGLAILAISSGIWLWSYGFTGGWLHAKLLLVTGLVIYHLICGKMITHFAQGERTKSPLWFRIFNEIPVFFLLFILILVILKPF
jgi:putative membrane protein